MLYKKGLFLFCKLEGMYSFSRYILKSESGIRFSRERLLDMQMFGNEFQSIVDKSSLIMCSLLFH